MCFFSWFLLTVGLCDIDFLMMRTLLLVKKDLPDLVVLAMLSSVVSVTEAMLADSLTTKCLQIDAVVGDWLT